MKEGAWIEARTGRHHWIDEHADWIRRPANARLAGLPEETVERLAAMPRLEFNGPEREAILLVAMDAGLIRFRGHGSFNTVESTLPMKEAIEATRPFMAHICGPFTTLRFNRLPDGPCIACKYQELEQVMERETC